MYTEEELKEKLLLTNCFNDNEWLDKYINLIINKSLVEKIKYKSAVHHIIPRHYFINENKNIDNSAKNLVYLYHEDHARAHLFLSLACKSPQLKQKNLSAMWFIISQAKTHYKKYVNDKSNINELLCYIDQLEKENLIVYLCPEKASQKVSNSTWYNNGEVEKYFSKNDIIPEGFTKGRLNSDFLKEIALDRVWLNNGSKQVHVKSYEVNEYLNNGYTYGMLDRGDAWRKNIKIAANNRSEEALNNLRTSKIKFHKEHPDFRNNGNFKPGESTHNKNRKAITNGKENHYIDINELSYWESLGFHLGQTQNKNKKVKVINNIDGTYKWISSASVDKYIALGYTIDYNAVGNTHKSKKDLK